MRKLFKIMIDDAIQRKEIILIYTDKNDTDRFSAGYVESFSMDFTLLKALDSNGESDGFILFRNMDIYSLEINGRYAKRLQMIAETKKKSVAWSNPLRLKGSKQSLGLKVMKECSEKKVLVTLKLIYDNGLTGFIKQIDGESLFVENVSDDGELDGLTCIAIDDIERLYFEGKEQHRILDLFTLNVEHPRGSGNKASGGPGK